MRRFLRRARGAQRDDVPERGHVLRELVDALGGIVWEADVAPFRLRFVSEDAERMLGHPLERWAALPEFRLRELVHPDDRARVAAVHRDASGRGGDCDCEYRVVTADGRVRWMREIVRATREASGRVQRLAGILVDVSAHKIAERRLLVEHAVTAALAESPTVAAATPRIMEAICTHLEWEWGALWTIDGDARVLRFIQGWHAPALDASAFERDSRARTFAPGAGLPGRVWQAGEPAWIVDVMADSNFPRGAAAARVGLHGAFAFPILLGGKVVGVLEFFSREKRARDDGLLEMLGTLGSQIGQFIERAGAEERLRASEEALADFFENASVGLHWLGPDGTILRANRAALEMLGYARDECVGHPIAAFQSDAAAAASLLSRLAAGETVRDHETSMRAKDGSVRHVLVDASVARDRAGRFVHTRCFTRDVTERRRAEAERAVAFRREHAARADAEAASRAKDEFLATVSHELRAPLTPMLLWIRMLRSRALDAATATHALEVIESNAKAQVQLVEDLLDVSRIVGGTLRLDVAPVTLTPVIEAALESVRPAADAKSVRLTVAPDGDATVVSGDAARLQQVVWNLVSNAVKFTPSGGDVEIRTARVGRDVELSVHDTGIGISAEFLPHVFERFRQADGAPTRAHGGLGLGLAIVRHLVELHGGTVRAESAGENCGARFIVRLPLRNADVLERPATPHPPPVPGRLQGRRILVVDDDADTLHALAAVLSRAGAELQLAESADAALRTLRDWRPDVLVSDVGLPDEDGYALLRRVRALPAAEGGDVPAVALTGYAGDEDRERGLAAGFQQHLAKPVDPIDLIEVVAVVANTPVTMPSGVTADVASASPTAATTTSATPPTATPLRRDDSAVREAVAFVSHELRQPIAALRIWLNLLEVEIGDALTDEAREHLEQIRASVGWMAELVTGRLLDEMAARAGRS